MLSLESVLPLATVEGVLVAFVKSLLFPVTVGRGVKSRPLLNGSKTDPLFVGGFVNVHPSVHTAWASVVKRHIEARHAIPSELIVAQWLGGAAGIVALSTHSRSGAWGGVVERGGCRPGDDDGMWTVRVASSSGMLCASCPMLRNSKGRILTVYRQILR